nr:MAG TPA: zinc finger protein [Caudoviricetes sp.]
MRFSNCNHSLCPYRHDNLPPVISFPYRDLL